MKQADLIENVIGKDKYFFLCSEQLQDGSLFKGDQVLDIRSLGFSWFLHHKVFMGRWFGGKNINLLF